MPGEKSAPPPTTWEGHLVTQVPRDGEVTEAIVTSLDMVAGRGSAPERVHLLIPLDL